MVNKANTVLREHNDLAGCERLVHEALAIDPDCDVAIITLAQLSLQQSKIEQAVTMFGRAREIARTEEELVQAVRPSMPLPSSPCPSLDMLTQDLHSGPTCTDHL
jgi:import receptor subunit TOM70